MFLKLCADETPMVRRAACGAFGGMAVAADPKDLRDELWGTFTALSKDDQDSVRALQRHSAQTKSDTPQFVQVRLHTVESAVQIASALSQVPMSMYASGPSPSPRPLVFPPHFCTVDQQR